MASSFLASAGALAGLGHTVSNISGLFDLNALPVNILAVGAGWLGGKLSGK